MWKHKGLVFRLLIIILYLGFLYSCWAGEFRVTKETKFAWVMYLLGVVVILSSTCMLYYLNAVKQTAIEKMYVFLAVILGFIYISVLPPYTVPDEKTHIDMAYDMANTILMGDEADTNNPETVYKRKSDADAVFQEMPDANVYRDMYHTMFQKCADETMVEAETKGYSTSRYLHAAGAFGIIAGRKLHFSTSLTFQLGRILNGSIFIIMIYWAIKRIPFGKKLVAVLALLPMTLQQANSFSYDSMINGAAILLIAEIMYLKYECEKIKSTDLLVVSICSLILAMPKGGSYLPLTFLILLVPKEKFQWKFPSWIYKILPLIFSVAGFLTVNTAAIFRISQEMETGIQIAWNNGTPGYTISDILFHPVEFLKIIFQSFWYKGGEYAESIIGGKLGWFEINIGQEVVILFAVVIVLAVVRAESENSKYKFCMKDYIWPFACFLVSMGLFMTIMFIQNTPVDSEIIIGVQGRYFTPIILLLFLTLPFKNIALKTENRGNLLEAVWMLQIITVSRVFLHIMLR